MTLGPARHAEVLAGKIARQGKRATLCRIFLPIEIGHYQAHGYTTGSTFRAPTPKINQSISRCAGARRVQLQKGPSPSPTAFLSLSNNKLHPRYRQTNPSHESHLDLTHTSIHLFSPNNFSKTAKMPPKAAADKKPAASKAPASKAPAEKKDAGKKTAASGDKKKRTKARKETYSSYIYKGEFLLAHPELWITFWVRICLTHLSHSAEASAPRHGNFQPCHVHPQLFRQRHLRARRH